MSKSTPLQLATRLNRLAAGIPAAQKEALVKAVLITEGNIQLAAGRYAGKRIAATRATYGQLSGQPLALIKMGSRKGHLLDHDTKAHSVAPRRKSALGGPRLAHPLSGAVNLPGTRGARFFEHGYELAQPKIAPLFGHSVAGAIAKAFV